MYLRKMSTCSFSKETHTPVIDNKSKELVFENGKLVLHEKSTNTIVYADLTESLVNTYNLSKFLKIIPPQIDNQSSTMNATKKLCTGNNNVVVLHKEQPPRTLPVPAPAPTPAPASASAQQQLQKQPPPPPSNNLVEKEIIEYTKKKFIVINPNTGRVIAVMGADDKKPNGTTVTSSTSSVLKTPSVLKPPIASKTSNKKTVNQASGSGNGTVSSTGTTKKRATWTTDATLSLINCYRQIDVLKIRNESIWRKINEAMKTKNYSFTSTQCKDRFYYLKSEYIKKLDNMKNDNKETEEITFDYYDEFNEIFGTMPSDIPEYAVSSRRSCLLSVGEIEEPQKDDKPTPKYKKRKLTNVDKLFKKTNENRERRESRHREKIELQKKALSELKIATELLKQALENKI
ncbi:hypothetical protein HCN44_009297 [Aphidius gifuensis]|uniref:Myb/SANT-like DNA-binding domain-containing protein n=1 Tax=Aphidius gifuensis TaxID=684658 RepID=A0A834Y620_APHGI|nr:uncharacterized protein LOC122859294 [Aphidius gifuensis]KAF7997899.1 hypothetical protein HCN44_009297 [Aphidius gifuensis]